MGELPAGVRPGLILVDGEEELSALAAERFAGVPVPALRVAPGPGRLPGCPLYRPGMSVPGTPRSTSAIMLASARCASRLPPRTVSVVQRLRPVTGSRPTTTRSCHLSAPRWRTEPLRGPTVPHNGWPPPGPDASQGPGFGP